VTLALPDATRVTAEGSVAWLRDTPDRSITPGMGIRFHGLAPEHRVAIGRFVAERPPMFYDAEG